MGGPTDAHLVFIPGKLLVKTDSLLIIKLFCSLWQNNIPVVKKRVSTNSVILIHTMTLMQDF